jgi:hypothetical protein
MAPHVRRGPPARRGGEADLPYLAVAACASAAIGYAIRPQRGTHEYRADQHHPVVREEQGRQRREPAGRSRRARPARTERRGQDLAPAHDRHRATPACGPCATVVLNKFWRDRVPFAAGFSAWAGSRAGRRHVGDLLATTARPALAAASAGGAAAARGGDRRLRGRRRPGRVRDRAGRDGEGVRHGRRRGPAPIDSASDRPIPSASACSSRSSPAGSSRGPGRSATWPSVSSR